MGEMTPRQCADSDPVDLWFQEGLNPLRRLSFLIVVLVAAVWASAASASELIDRDAAGVRLAVNAKG
jgi:hypothetical protein